MNILTRLHSSFAKAAPYLVLAIAFVLLTANASYSFNWIDESFYAALVDGLNKGASPFVDEWHPAQVYAVLLLPFYKAWLTVSGSSDGVIYFFRLVYTLFAFVVSLVIYKTLSRSFAKFISCCCALVYLFYIRANILGMSYYSLCLSFFILGLLASWCTWKNLKHDTGEAGSARVILPLLAGVAFGLACICNPYVVFFILITFIAAIIFSIAAKQRNVIAAVAWLVLGAVVVAVIYLWFIFLRTSPAELFANIGNVLSSHDENLSFWQRIPNYLSFLPITRVGSIGLALVVVVLIALRAKKVYIKPAVKLIILIFCLALFVYDCAVIFQQSNHPQKIMLAFVEFAIPCYLLSDNLNIKQHSEFIVFWLPGILFSIIWQFSSNTQICGILIGYCVVCLGSIITVYNSLPYIHDTRLIEQAAPVLNIVTICCFVAGIAFARLFSVYSDAPYSEMTAQINSGPAAGLYTSEKHLAQYEGLEELLAKIDNNNGVWIEPMAPWGYLEVDGVCAATSAWNTFMSKKDAEIYYGEGGHEYPGWILVTSDNLGKSVNVLAGRVQDNISLEMYYDYNAKLRENLNKSSDYAPVAKNKYGVLYKRAEHSYINAGSNK